MLAPRRCARPERPPLLSQLRVPPGFEAAIAALFDGELAAPLSPDAGDDEDCGGRVDRSCRRSMPRRCPRAHVRWPQPSARRRRWRAASPMPAGSRARPRAGGCSRCFAPGQRLVDRDGRLWRWDGFIRSAPGSHRRRRAVCASATGLTELDGEIAAASRRRDSRRRAPRAARGRRASAAAAAERAARRAARRRGAAGPGARRRRPSWRAAG